MVYITVALVNSSLVQSFIGSVASDYFSKEWGGKIKIGSIGCNPIDHLVLRNVEMVNPDNDTICTAHTVAIRFSKFPIDEHGLTMDRVYLKDVNYHLNIDSTGINLRYIIDYYRKEKPKEKKPAKEFKVVVGDLVMDNVNYKQDLKERPNHVTDSVGVDIPHMEYRNIRGRIRNLRVDKSHVTCRIDRLTTTERSGMEVRKMSMNVFVSPVGISVTDMILETGDSHLEGDVLLEYRDWKTMKHYVDSVYMVCNFINGSYGGMRDATFWAHKLWGMDQKIDVSGCVWGPVKDLHAEGMKLAFGNNTRMDVDAYIYGLPNIDTTIIGGEIRNFHTTYEDLAAVKHPRNITMKAPELIKQLDFIDMDASFTGTIFDFYATIDMNTALGDIVGDLVLKMDPKKKTFRYVGELSSSNMGIARIAPNEWVSRSGFELSFEGSGLDPKTMNASATGRLHHITLRGQRLLGEAAFDIDANDGTVVADISLDDNLADITAHGEVSWRETGPMYNAEIYAKHVDLKRFGLWNDDEDSTAVIDLHAQGRYFTVNDNRSYARFALENLYLNTTTKNYRLNNATVSARENNKYKTFTLNSDIMTAEMRGYFEYAGLGQMFSKFASDYLPRNIFKTPSGGVQSTNNDLLAGSQFEIDAQWLDTSGILETFVPQLFIARGTTIQANYNYVESFKPIVRSDSIRYGSICLRNVGMNGESVSDRYRIRVTSDEITLGSLKMSENADLLIESSDEDAVCRIYWENSDKTVGGGDVNLRLVNDSIYSTPGGDAQAIYEGGHLIPVTRLIVDKSQLSLGEQLWELTDEGGDVFFGDGKYYADGLRLQSGNQMLSLRASHLGRTNDEIKVKLNDFGLEPLNPYLGLNGVSVSGVANGNVDIGGLNEVPYLNADMLVDGLLFNNEPLGDARIRSTWNAEMNQLNLHVGTRRLEFLNEGDSSPESGPKISEPLQLVGYVALGKNDPDIEFTATLNDLNLKMIQPFVNSFSSSVDGAVTADLNISGTLKSPIVEGFVIADKAAMKVDMLNVTYSLSDTLYLDTASVKMNDVVLTDDQGNVALLNGSILHNHIKDIRFDLSLRTDKLLCMNTTAKQSNIYYGTVLASANGTVRGPSDNIDIMLDARTLPGSQLFIPVSDNKQVKSADYIHFVSDKDDLPLDYGNVFSPNFIIEPESPYSSHSSVVVNDKSDSRFSLTINVETNPDLTLQIPMTSSAIDANIKAKGGGDLQLRLSTGSPFSLIGDYEMNDGTISLNFLGVKSLDFSVDEGSRITFPGAVEDALFDLKAVYSQRVNMSSLTGSLSATESQKQINVENVIAISGTIQNPDINFDIRLPNADQSVQEEVFAYIDRTNERDMLNQTVYLLLFNQFYNSSTTSDVASTSVVDGGYSFVANNLGSVISSMVQVVDVNFAYKAGNALTTEQYAVDISKEWNKFYFETTFGFGGEAREMSDVNNNNNMTGDMLVGYKINPRLHLFVFNRSNTNDYTRSDLPYKQGVGLKYTRDFDNLGELFRRRNKKNDPNP